MFIARVKSSVRTERRGAKITDVQIDVGGGDLRLAENYGSPGDDSLPLPGDYAVTVGIPRSGGVVAVAYLNPGDAQTAEPGEKRLYSRTAAGALAAQLFMRADGSVTLANAAGGISLGADGTVTINGVTISPAGVVTDPGGITLNGHHHISAAPGSPTGPALP